MKLLSAIGGFFANHSPSMAASVTVAFVTALFLSIAIGLQPARRRLPLDTRHDGIADGSAVILHSAGRIEVVGLVENVEIEQSGRRVANVVIYCHKRLPPMLSVAVDSSGRELVLHVTNQLPAASASPPQE